MGIKLPRSICRIRAKRTIAWTAFFFFYNFSVPMFRLVSASPFLCLHVTCVHKHGHAPDRDPRMRRLGHRPRCAPQAASRSRSGLQVHAQTCARMSILIHMMPRKASGAAASGARDMRGALAAAGIACPSSANACPRPPSALTARALTHELMHARDCQA